MLARFSGVFARQSGRVAQVSRPAAARFFSNANQASNDGSLQDRYAFALFDASNKTGKLDKVFEDLSGLKENLVNSEDFKIFIQTPSIKAEDKDAIFVDIAKKSGAQDITVNLVKLLIENKRLQSLPKVIDSFEKMYRTSKGEVTCVVTSAAELNAAQKKQVEEALKTRLGASKKAIVSFKVSPTILGGLQVALGDAVLDYSVASKIGRFDNLLQTQV